ncbi:MAG: tetratricopeptide repeat protein [Anaeromyxobacteraceae bacterium]
MPWIRGFVAELQRRRVIRALAIWGVAAFAVLQVYEPVMHGLHLPDWTLSFVVVVLGLGFPVTAALAWSFDLTARGLERTPAVTGEAAGEPAPARGGGLRLALPLAVVGLMAAAPGLVYFFVWPGPGPRAAAPAASAVAAPQGAPSIAVLPFVDMSPGKDQEYFSDGISEEILNALAQVKGLRVIGRTSSFSMKGRNEDLRSVGQRLNAANLLEGSVRRAGSKVRITAQLIETAGGSHLWSKQFDRELTDVFAVQEEIARAVVAALEVALLPGAAAPARTADAEAHDLYLRGLDALSSGSVDGFESAVKLLERVVARDPGYAPAWAALSRARFWAADQGNLDQRTEWPRALREAERAVALAPASFEGFFARGSFRLAAQQDWTGALADLERARDLNPGSPDVLLQYGALLATLGRMREADETIERAVLLDPLHASAHVGLSIVRMGEGRLDEALLSATRALELAPQNNRAARTLGFVLLLQGKLPEARLAFRRSTNVLFSRMGDAMIDHTLGNAAASQRMVDAIVAEPGVHEGGAYQVTQVFAWRGEPERALEWLGRAIDSHDAGTMYLRYDPVLKGLRSDPRYRKVLERLKLPLD